MECKASENLWWGHYLKRDLWYSYYISRSLNGGSLLLRRVVRACVSSCVYVYRSILPLKMSHAMNYCVPSQQDEACEGQ